MAFLDKVHEHEEWIKNHQKKSVRHSIYFGIVVGYLLVDFIIKVISWL